MKGFSKTRTPNLWRNDASQRFYAVGWTPGKTYPVLKSLKTDKESVAKLRLEEALAKIRTNGSSPSRDKMTMGECIEAYLSGKRDEGLKELSYKYCARSVAMLRENLSKFDARQASEFTPLDCKTLCDRLRAKYSKRRFNGALWSLRGILDVAVKSKVIKENPADDIKPAVIHQEKLELPSEAKIEQLMEYMRRHRQQERGPKGKARPSTTRPPHSFDAFLFLTLMVESSARPGSIRLLRPEHVNLKHGTVDWLPFKHSTTTDTLPMTRKMKAVFRLLLMKHPGGNAPLVPITSPRKALIHACAAVEIQPALTPHKFRHICSTRMAERNVPYALAAQWRRDTDGGGTFMKVYVHPRNESLRAVVNALEQPTPKQPSTSAPTSSTASSKSPAMNNTRIDI